MEILKPLRHRPIALLWSGQVFSCVGDEVYSVAIVWLAASLIGNDAGYLTAIQAGSVLVCSLFGGIWADNWDHRRAMVSVDLIRGVVVAILPIVTIFRPISLWSLIPVMIVVSSLRAFFDPAVTAVIPQLVPEKKLLHATNSLMETTGRLARVIGPALVGLLNRLVPIIHFFTFDAVSFLVSAASVNALKKSLPKESEADPARPLTFSSIRAGLFGGAEVVSRNPLMKYIIITSSVAIGGWLLVLPLGIGLLVHQKMPENVGAFGWVISAYGVGNLVSNLFIGSMPVQNPERVLFSGRVTAGIGMLGLAAAPTFVTLMLAAALTALGGPMNDVARLNLILTEFESKDVAKVHRLGLSLSYGWLLLMYLASPTLFAMFSVPIVVALCGVTMIGSGVVGFVRFRAHDTLLPPNERRTY